MSMDLWGLSPLLQFIFAFIVFVSFGAAGAWLEWKFPARSPGLSWKKVYLGEDALVLMGIVVAGGILQVFQLKFAEFFGLANSSPAVSVGSGVKSFLLVFGVLDFLMYWLHRSMHSKILWPIHRFHHSIQRMNWLSGVRLSLTELFLSSVPSYAIYLVWPETLPWGVIYFFYTNILIHLNLDIRSPWIAQWLVLPRYHRLHHGLHHGLVDSGMDSRFNNRNFSVCWVFWDRLFGTYLNPVEIQDDFPLGIKPLVQKENNRWKMAVGI